MSAEENRALVRKNIELLNGRNLDAAVGQLAPNFIDHEAQPGTPDGPEGVRRFFTTAYSAFPDFNAAIEDVIAEGDRVMIRSTVSGTHSGPFRGIPPTGKRVQFGLIDIYRVADGKIAEHWGLTDFLTLMQQVGAVPPLATR